MKNLLIKSGVVVGATVASTAMFAVDVSTVTGGLLTDGTAALTAVGMALVGLAGVTILFKWIKAAIFG
ncbi:hypothetical protein tloyanaT_21000 [Thalassotalea loyana]|uniref:Methyltransferase n=1 Tax=Thalassotalea loyana TaxID=280483 RepID=A0ABQ6HCK6_9GAMM|nr:major capsid protein [Thalassotalea loyana]GLX85848.1 hypothetical protein tloyanaT_21000 [Thalassotalea loyana]